ncbi:MAG TPA: c-type cytochrome [Thermoanaerobaculia bacterium]|jgi:cytochrome c2|nr:c-type cytochrome [Thermoanaerobaculia bacterium]
MKRLALILLLLVAAACNRDEASKSPAPAKPAPTGNIERGRALAGQYGCNVCHVMPGIDGPQGSLGPSLAGIASRPAISFGTVQNTPANLTQFIQNPASLNPQSSMPPIGLAEADAKDIAAYLMTLR